MSEKRLHSMSRTLPRPIGKQREVLYLPASGHTVVLGTAGSGKTTLAILRALYLTDATTDHCGPTLLVTFNRCLVTYMKHLAPHLPEGLEVTNYHRFARGYLNSRGLMDWNSICTPRERRRFVAEALAVAQACGLKGPITERTPKFLDEEIRWIQQQGIGDEATYVAAERVGRSGSWLSRADRPALFRIYEHYLAQRQRGGKVYDWDSLASAVLCELSSDTQARRFRHVVVDEGQDFSPVMLQSLATAVPANNGSLTFFGDMAQQIYGHRISWRTAGLLPPRVWRFEQNYRNTRQIALLALALAEMPDFKGVPDLVEPVAPTADGPLPVLQKCASEEQELQLVARQAGALARTGTVAVLFRTRPQEKRGRRYLPRGCTQLKAELSHWPSGPGLFHGTYHAAKGLEFDSVFLPHLADSQWPDPADMADLGSEEEVAAQDSKLLYVGITRARSALVLTYTGSPTRLLPRDADLYQA